MFLSKTGWTGQIPPLRVRYEFSESINIKSITLCRSAQVTLSLDTGPEMMFDLCFIICQ